MVDTDWHWLQGLHTVLSFSEVCILCRLRLIRFVWPWKPLEFFFYFLVNVWKAAGFSLIWHLISVVILESMSCQKKTVINTCKNVIAALCYNVFFKQGKIVCLFLYFIVILCASKTVCYTWYICIQRLRCSSSRGAPTSSIRMSVYARTGIEWWCCSKSFFGRT